MFKIIKKLTFLKPFLIIALIIIAALIGREDPSADPAADRDPQVTLGDYFPSGTEFARTRRPEILKANSPGGELLGYAAYGPPQEETIIGRAGRVPFVIIFNTDFKIRKVIMLDNRETASYAESVALELEDAWQGMTYEQARDHRVDAVSGATQTSDALIEGIRATAAQLTDEEARERLAATVTPAQIITLLFLLAALTLFFMPAWSRRLRRWLPMLRFLIPGIISAAVLSIGLVEGWLSNQVSISVHFLLLAVAAPAFLIPLFTGKNFYCYHYCPYGAIQDIAFKLVKKKIKLPRLLIQVITIVRWLLLILAGLTLAGFVTVELAAVEPFAAFRWAHAPALSRAIAGVFLALSFITPRLWCRICPTGRIIEGLRYRRR